MGGPNRHTINPRWRTATVRPVFANLARWRTLTSSVNPGCKLSLPVEYDWTIHARRPGVGYPKTSKPIEMPFRGLTHAGSRNNVVVGWARWHQLVNTIEPSALPSKKQQRISASAHIILSRADALDCHIKFYSLKIPLRCSLSSKARYDFFAPKMTQETSVIVSYSNWTWLTRTSHIFFVCSGIIDICVSQTINQFQKIEFMLKVTGPKPITVAWFINDATKLKSSKNRKVTYSSTSGEAKMLVMEADAEDDGDYKIVASNEFGEVSQTCKVSVVSEYSPFTFPFDGEIR